MKKSIERWKWEKGRERDGVDSMLLVHPGFIFLDPGYT